MKHTRRLCFVWWAHQDSNLGSRDYELEKQILNYCFYYIFIVILVAYLHHNAQLFTVNLRKSPALFYVFNLRLPDRLQSKKG